MNKNYRCFDCREDFEKIYKCEECGSYLCLSCSKLHNGLCEECYEEINSTESFNE